MKDTFSELLQKVYEHQLQTSQRLAALQAALATFDAKNSLRIQNRLDSNRYPQAARALLEPKLG